MVKTNISIEIRHETGFELQQALMHIVNFKKENPLKITKESPISPLNIKTPQE